MSQDDDVIRLQGYIRKPALKKAVSELKKIYGDNELVNEALRCLAIQKGLLPAEGAILA